jgi:hypothetical protein
MYLRKRVIPLIKKGCFTMNTAVSLFTKVAKNFVKRETAILFTETWSRTRRNS